MVESEIFKKGVESLISQNYKIEFLGKNFDKIVGLLNDTKVEKIYKWIEEVVNKTVQPILVGSKKKYKNWEINQLLTFRHQFNISDIEYRILIVKVKNSIYIEFHLGDHKYYDKIRKSLDLKKNN